MKVKTVIEPRIKPMKKAKSKTKLMAVVASILNLIFGTMIPFLLGFYFALTTNWWILAIFITWLLFDFRFEVKGDGSMNIRIIRGI